jgi:hypothetical protein
VADAVATSASTSSATYTTVLTPASPGPAVTVTVPASGKVLVAVTSGMQATNGSTSMFMSFALSGANTQAASDSRALILLGNNLQQSTASFVVSGLTPGSTTFTAQYKVSGSGTATFSNRSMFVIPLS